MTFPVVLAAVLSIAGHQSPPPNSSQDMPSRWYSNVGEGTPPFWVRPGYKVTTVADKLVNARFMQFDDKGNLFLSRPNKGDILVLRRDKDGNYKVASTFVTGHRSVHGLDFKDGWLWFTESGAVFKARDTNGDGKADEEVALLKDLPSGGHWWRPIFVVDDGFFTGIGDSGNLTESDVPDRQKIWKYSLDGKTRKLWASGIRNTEKLRYRPGTTELYGADHGSDWFGQPLGDKKGDQPITDWNPPCEFNLYVEGGFYGHPFITGNRVPRIEFQKRPDLIELANKTIPPMWNFGAHWAPNGFSFASKGDFAGDAIVALHGSWNSLKPVGYRVERVMFDRVTGAPYGAQILVGGIGQDGNVIGRPVDVVEEPDGNLLFSDDETNRIYRISPAK